MQKLFFSYSTCEIRVKNEGSAKLNLRSLDFTGGPRWARTIDHLIMSQVL